MNHIFSADRDAAVRYAAFFDLDRTLIREISGKAIVRMAWKKGLISLPDLARSFYLYLLFKLGLKDPLEVIGVMVGWVKGKPEAELAELCQYVFREVLLPSLFQEAVTEISAHKDNNARVIILSSSLNYICCAISESLGLDGFICSSLEAREGYLTGRPAGTLCYGEEKLHRMNGYCAANNLNKSDVWYYSDSISDLPALSFVGNPVCINPDKALRREAIKRGWRILLWKK